MGHFVMVSRKNSAYFAELSTFTKFNRKNSAYFNFECGKIANGHPDLLVLDTTPMIFEKK
jgi:hypothetical protein